MTADASQTARAWPAAQVEMWQVADLVPYARNARQHPADQIDQIAASMQRFGFTIPMLVAEDGTIIAGHGRLMAAAQLGLAEVPVMVARGWTEEDRRLYTLADNRLAEIAEWDPEMLRLEIEDLRLEFGIEDFGMIGFSADDLAEMLPDALVETTGGLTDPDDVPDLPETPVTRPGDVWILGAHRLLCGDSTVATDVEKVLRDVKPLLMCTDPPYGVAYDPAWRNSAGAAKTKRTGKVLNDDRADWREAWARRLAADPEGPVAAASEPALRRMADGLAHRARALRLLGNGVHPLGEWDEAILRDEIAGLLAEDFDIGLIGIPDDELDALLNDPDDRAPMDDDAADTIPEAPAEPITRPGDIWALGDHRLICGDATDPAVVARLMDGAQATLMFTSPPYAQQRDYGAAKEKVGDWDALMQGVFAAAPVTADAQLLVNLGPVHRNGEWPPYWEVWVDWMRAQGWRRFGWYVWDQGPGLPGDWNGRLAPSHEFIFHFNRAPRKPNKTVESKHAGETLGGGGLRGADGTVHRKTGTGNAIQSHRIPDNVFRIMRHKGGLGAAGSHPAVFPVALVEAVLEAFTDPGDLVFEPFCGSGTQLIAADRTGRRCCAVELDPAYCDVAVRRWEMATGNRAKRHAKQPPQSQRPE